MKKEMIYLPIKEFIMDNLDFKIAVNRKDSEYDFQYTRWKTLIFSSQKLKFILKYTQSVFQWLSKLVDVSNFSISIDTTTVDRFNMSIYEFDTHIFNCALTTNFYLIPEEEWAKKIYETHYSRYDILNGEPQMLDQSSFWKGEEGFEKLVNFLYAILKEPYKFEKITPIQWQIEFKDRKLTSSQIRMQIASLNQVGVKPEDPYLTFEYAEQIEAGVSPEKIVEEMNQNSKSQQVINPIWDEGIEQEEKYKDLNYAMKKVNGLIVDDDKRVVRKKRRR